MLFPTNFKRLSNRFDPQTRRKIVLVAISEVILITVLISMLYFHFRGCGGLDGALYRSPREVDNLFGGTMHPEVYFSDGSFLWVISDMLISGVYECKSGMLTVYYNDGYTTTAEIDTSTGNLRWREEEYVRVSR